MACVHVPGRIGDLHHAAGLPRVGARRDRRRDDVGAIAVAARRVGALTHYDPRAQEACILWSLAIRHAIVAGKLDVRGGLGLLSAEAAAYWEERLDDAERREPPTFTPNGWVVTALQAAWSAIRQDAELQAFYRSVCRRHPRHVGPRVAIVAVARKLSARIAAVLMEQRPYVVRHKVHSAPLTQEETSPQGTTRRPREPGEKNS